MAGLRAAILRKAMRYAMRGRFDGKTSIVEMRREIETLIARYTSIPADVAKSDVELGGISAAWFVPRAAADGVALLYLHGGGFVMGSIGTYAEQVARIARSAGVKLLLPAYRLAPEHPFPAALDDARAAYASLLDAGYAGGRIVLMGDSAGGGLAAALLVSLREAKQALPAAAVLLSPWLDLSLSGPSVVSQAAADPVLRAEVLRGWAGHYLGETDARTPLASPLFADLAGLPPVLLQVGTEEILVDDAKRFFEIARAAGVRVELDIWEGMMHGWHGFSRLIPEAERAIDRIGVYTRAALGLAPRR